MALRRWLLRVQTEALLGIAPNYDRAIGRSSIRVVEKGFRILDFVDPLRLRAGRKRALRSSDAAIGCRERAFPDGR